MLTIDDAKNLPLWGEQMQIEEEMRSLGVERFRKMVDDARESEQETRTTAGRHMMRTTHQQMVAALDGFYGDVETKKAGRKHSAYAYLKELDQDVVAHLTCRIILDSISQRKRLTHLSVMIAEALEDECNYRAFREQNEPAYLKAAGRARKKGNAKYRRRSTLGTAKKVGVNLLEWPKRDMVLVGSKLVELFTEATALVQLVRERDAITVEMRPEVREAVEKQLASNEWLSPMYLPTVIPPRPWTSPFEGGYWSGRARRLTLVKSPNRQYLKELAARDMPEVYTAINALQNTGWMVNARVLEVMETLFENGSRLDVIPGEVSELDLPQKPAWLVEAVTKEEMTEEQLAEFKAWKGECVRVRDEMASSISRRSSFGRMMWVARKFSGKEFFYPHQLDWRGRGYPVSLYLQPQGNDAQRGLLEFSTSCPINNQEGADWLAIHGAGLWGVDKVSMQERVGWVKQNEAAILAVAEDPFANLFWTEAEKPWSALAFCLDWAGFVAHGFGYESSLPVQMDGTCNGLQNFSAILRDEVGGAAVNLVPAAKPQDIYSQVGAIVAEWVERDAGEGNQYALGWLGKITRKVVKRPVMTLAYGARQYGFTTMIFEDTVKKWKQAEPATFPFGHEGFQAAQYLAKLTWDAVGNVVVKAAEAMDWLQEAARTVSKEGLPIHWVTPTGFLVQQAYRVRSMKAIDLAFQSVRLQLYIDEGTPKLDTKRQASGISPNWIHSLDASHMMRTICAATCAGVEAFSFIHDSYGTHAGNCAALATLLRESFVQMYSDHDVLASFRDDLETMGVTLKAIPAKGSLDLSQVLESEFFFA